MNPKVSIIVPVYKVEPYIHQCVDSILSQTFKDFELILVDDGSPDNCGRICDEYAEKDERIRVIHKQNGGLSTARNAGLDIAIGDYIGFVDSDDWIESDMYELLYDMCIRNDCEIANCTSTIHYKDKVVINDAHSLTIHNRRQAMKALLEGELYDEVVWTKLFKRSLLENVRFKVGIVYEDTEFTYRVIHKADKVCCIGAPKYNYIKRDSGTMAKAIKNINIDAVLIYDEMYQFIKQHYSYLSNLVLLKLNNSAMIVLNLILSNQNFEKNKDKYFKVSGILNKYFSETLKLSDYPKSVKVLLIANRINPHLYKLVASIALKKKNMKKKLLEIYYLLLKIKDCFIALYNKNITKKRKVPFVRTTDETLEKIITGKCSVSRYGDGEFGLMYGNDLIFQKNSPELRARLIDIVKSQQEKHIVCIPNVFSSLDKYTEKSKQYWTKYLNLNIHKIYKILDMKKEHFDSLVTRLYIDSKDKSQVGESFLKFKKVWSNRDIIIIEGQQSRLGIGNDLFDNVNSLNRIICPAKNAFTKYNEILDTVIKQDKSKLILIALGPTATVLAYDLSIIGYQAIDIGHIDIEYEWFLQKATDKCPVSNKYIGEVANGTAVESIQNIKYESQIVDVIA